MTKISDFSRRFYMRKKLRFFVRIAAALCAALAGMTACAAEAEEGLFCVQSVS